METSLNRYRVKIPYLLEVETPVSEEIPKTGEGLVDRARRFELEWTTVLDREFEFLRWIENLNTQRSILSSNSRRLKQN